ncbi:endoplasmic reticulum protein [Coprinopsis cinerea okayama7|uniref:Endoplasmic reticulum protein n=1 Tax=Coprinopsis cinerea (strain Okayama-7 / 130 / ATCC MYA-4618 / FGSC 9003) TaxID=240176 RepID=A8N5U9_COPC7|nr:endoplasmic reticulum protein [Coprinopsis cinerea okayama7\|eukprot:XP_001830244.2 endoplasmic reticulum protein [Coprinopsis cinerea okayama7\
MGFTFRKQPLKGLYLVYQLLTTLFVRPLRPRASWSHKKAVWVKFIRHMGYIGSQTGPFVKTPNHTAITPGKGVNGVWIEGAGHLLTGEIKSLADFAKVVPCRIPGYWIHKKDSPIEVASPPQPGEKVILNLHGGAYVRLSAHPNDPTANIPFGLLQHADDSVQRVLSVEYRLSSGEPFIVANPFPSALIDALAGYNYLVNTIGFSPASIIITGDSAGGNLAHALTRYLVEHQNQVAEGSDARIPAPPGGLVLLSPWVDLSDSHDSLPEASSETCLSTDYIDVRQTNQAPGVKGGIAYAKSAFEGPHGSTIANSNPYVSPASRHPSFKGVSFKGFPRTFIVGGGAEVLIDQIRTFKKRMVEDLGEGDGVGEEDGKVRYHEAPDGIHDYLAFPWHEPERTDTIKEIVKWIQAA